MEDSLLPDRRTFVALIALVLAISLSACGQSAERLPEATEDKPQTRKVTTINEEKGQLAGTEWTLRSLRGENTLSNVFITLEIEKKEYGGFAGCNWYGGDYSSGNGSLEFASGMMTSMGNPSVEACQQENTYVNTLAKAVSYRM